MGVSSEIARIKHVGSGVGPYTFPWSIYEEGDILVTTRDSTDLTGVETDLVLTTDYTVDFEVDTDGGSITLTSSLAATSIIVIRLNMEMIQEDDIRNQGPLPRRTIEDMADKAAKRDQTLEDVTDRSIKTPETVPSSEWSTTLPPDLANHIGDAIGIGETGVVLIDVGSGSSAVDLTRCVKVHANTNLGNFDVVLPDGIETDYGQDVRVSGDGTGFVRGTAVLAGVKELYGTYANWALPVEAALGAGYSVILPGGDLPVTTNIDWPTGSTKHGLFLRGRSRGPDDATAAPAGGVTRLICSGAATIGISLDGTAVVIDEAEIADLCVDCNAVAATGILCRDFTNLRLTNVHVYDSTGDGIELREGTGAVLTNVRARTNVGHGIVIGDDVKNVDIYSPVCDDNTLYGMYFGPHYGTGSGPQKINIFGGRLTENDAGLAHVQESEDVHFYGTYASMTGPTSFAITGVSNANPGVVTCAGHTFIDDDVIFIHTMSGMQRTISTSLNGQQFIVDDSAVGSFSLNDMTGANYDTTNLTPWELGGSAKLATFAFRIDGGANPAKRCVLDGVNFEDCSAPNILIGDAEYAIVVNCNVYFGLCIGDDAENTYIGRQSYLNEFSYSDRGEGTVCKHGHNVDPGHISQVTFQGLDYTKKLESSEIAMQIGRSGYGDDYTEMYAPKLLIRTQDVDQRFSIGLQTAAWVIDINTSGATYTITNGIPEDALVITIVAMIEVSIAGGNIDGFHVGDESDTDKFSVCGGTSVNQTAPPFSQTVAYDGPWPYTDTGGHNITLNARKTGAPGTWNNTGRLNVCLYYILPIYTTGGYP